MGPKELPKVLRKLGQWAGKLRRMAADLRAQSGIDDALRVEGLDKDIGEIRKLARGELDGVMKAAVDLTGRDRDARASRRRSPAAATTSPSSRDRENPREGADSYGALPDNAIVYDNTLPKSPARRDPLYMLGDAKRVLPPSSSPSRARAEPEPRGRRARARDASSAETRAPRPGGGA